MWRITATDREGREVARHELEAGDLTIGRDADRQMVLAAPSVSRRHCRLRIDQTGVVIMDEGSANGVIVNGVRITAPTPVNQMSRIEVAEFRVAVEPIVPARSAMAGLVESSVGMGLSMGMSVPGQMIGQLPPGMPQDVVRLIAEGGPYDGRIFDLPPLQEMAVGRAVDNDLVLDDPSMSRRHAKLRRLGGGRMEVEDVNSANGTYVNGRKIQKATVGPGDTLRFGELMFRIDGGGLSPQVQPRSSGAPQAAPPLVVAAFWGLVALALVTNGMWIWRFLTPPPAPQRGQAEEALAKKIRAADELVKKAEEELRKKEWTRAKSLAAEAQDIDPANRDAASLYYQAIRAEDDYIKYKQGMADVDQGSLNSLQSALSKFHAMSPGGFYRTELASKLSAKLREAGQELCRSARYRECAVFLCDAYRVALPNQKPTVILRQLHEAERKGRVTAKCILR